MIDFDIDRLQKGLDGKFNVAHLIINRVKKLKTGVEPKTPRRMREKDIVLAIREIEGGDLEYDKDENSTRKVQVELGEIVITEHRPRLNKPKSKE